MSLPSLLYGRERWTDKKREKYIIQASEMNFMRNRAGCMMTDHKRYVKIKELNDQVTHYRHK
jgi:hypothetical protein